MPPDVTGPPLLAEPAWLALLALRTRLPDARGQRRVEVVTGGHVGLDTHGDWWSGGTRPDAAARALLDLYAPVCAPPGRAFVIGQMGQSLDGRTATSSGHSHYVTGPEDRQRLHRLRALVDAVVVGAGTVAADDPRLTVRDAPGDHPVRVVLDPDDRLSAGHAVFTDGAATTLRVTRRVPGRTGGPGTLALDSLAPAGILDALARHGLHRVLIEGGGRTVSRFLEAGCLHRLHVTVAPVLIGAGPVGFNLSPIERMDQARRPPARRFHLGADVLFDLALADGGEPPTAGD